MKEVHRYLKNFFQETQEVDEVTKLKQTFARNLSFPTILQKKAETEEELNETQLSSTKQTIQNGPAPRNTNPSPTTVFGEALIKYLYS